MVTSRRQLAVAAALGAAVALPAGAAPASRPSRYTFHCSIYRAPIHGTSGDAILTFTNRVAPKLPGGAHGEPPFDCAGAAAELTAATPHSADEWSTSKPTRFRTLHRVCLARFAWVGETVTATLRSISRDDPTCGYLIRHGGP